jgi:hypothetical protein
MHMQTFIKCTYPVLNWGGVWNGTPYFPSTCFIRYSHVNFWSSVGNSVVNEPSDYPTICHSLCIVRSQQTSLQLWLILRLFNETFFKVYFYRRMVRLLCIMNRKGAGKSWLLPVWSYYPSVCVKGLKKTTIFAVTTAGFWAGIRTQDLTL